MHKHRTFLKNKTVNITLCTPVKNWKHPENYGRLFYNIGKNLWYTVMGKKCVWYSHNVIKCMYTSSNI